MEIGDGQQSSVGIDATCCYEVELHCIHVVYLLSIVGLVISISFRRNLSI